MEISRGSGFSFGDKEQFGILVFAVLKETEQQNLTDVCIPSNFYIPCADGQTVGIPIVQIFGGDENLEGLLHDVVSRTMNNQESEFESLDNRPISTKMVAILSEDRAKDCPEGCLEVVLEEPCERHL